MHCYNVHLCISINSIKIHLGVLIIACVSVIANILKVTGQELLKRCIQEIEVPLFS